MNSGQFPREIRRVLYPRVHSLTTDWRVNMRGIPSNKNVSHTITFGLSIIHMKWRDPGGRPHGRLNVSPVDCGLEVSDCDLPICLGLLFGMGGNDHSHELLRESSHEHNISVLEVNRKFLSRNIRAVHLKIP